MNHLSPDEQSMVLERPGDYSVRTRNDVADQQKQTTETVALRDASQRLSALVRRAIAGETIIITVRGEVSAQLCPVPPRIEAAKP